MILSLDSSIVIDLMRGKQADVRRRFHASQAQGAEFKLSVVALYELVVGAKKSAQPEAKLEELDAFLALVDVIPFDGEDAMVAGALRAELEPLGAPLETADLLIGAQALNRGWPLVTSNIRHLGRLSGVTLYNWRVSSEPLDQNYIIARLRGEPED